MPFITLISKIALQNLTKSHELQGTHAVSHEPRKLQTKNQKKTLILVPFIAIFRQASRMHLRDIYCNASFDLCHYLLIYGCGGSHRLKGILNFQKAYHAPVSSPCSSLYQLPTALPLPRCFGRGLY